MSNHESQDPKDSEVKAPYPAQEQEIAGLESEMAPRFD
jgi:hypothetical protein